MYVLDTSVLLSDPWAVTRFAEHAVNVWIEFGKSPELARGAAASLRAHARTILATEGEG